MNLCKDPVCGMLVEPSHASSVVEYDDTLYYFCCDGCEARFIAGMLDLAVLQKAPLRVIADDADSHVVHLYALELP